MALDRRTMLATTAAATGLLKAGCLESLNPDEPHREHLPDEELVDPAAMETRWLAAPDEEPYDFGVASPIGIDENDVHLEVERTGMYVGATRYLRALAERRAEELDQITFVDLSLPPEHHADGVVLEGDLEASDVVETLEGWEGDALQIVDEASHGGYELYVLGRGDVFAVEDGTVILSGAGFPADEASRTHVEEIIDAAVGDRTNYVDEEPDLAEVLKYVERGQIVEAGMGKIRENAPEETLAFGQSITVLQGLTELFFAAIFADEETADANADAMEGLVAEFDMVMDQEVQVEDRVASLDATVDWSIEAGNGPDLEPGGI